MPCRRQSALLGTAENMFAIDYWYRSMKSETDDSDACVDDEEEVDADREGAGDGIILATSVTMDIILSAGMMSSRMMSMRVVMLWE